jgi:hypothetical protein
MLKKLLKYEWKDTSRLLLPINLAIIVLTILGCSMLSTSIFDSEASIFFAVPLLILYILSILTFSSVTIIYIYVRFYKNLYTAEGYLMHTLPVTPMQLFHSKLIVGCSWFGLNSLLTTLSFMALGFAAGFHQASTNINVDTININLDPSASFADIFGYPLPTFLLWMLALLILSAFSSILMEYVSILLGQQMERNKLAASVAFYFGIYVVIQIITSVAMMVPEFITLSNTTDEEFTTNFLSETLRMAFPMMSIIYLAVGIAFYIICRVLMNRKVNLD